MKTVIFEMEGATMLGPVDYVILGFNGNNFDASILSELVTATKNKTIRVIDVLFIMKDQHGNVIEGEYEDQSPSIQAALREVYQEDDLPLLTEQDISKIGERMDPGTSAAVLIIEHVWARKLKGAVRRAGGFVIDDGRVHESAALAAVEELEQQTSIH